MELLIYGNPTLIFTSAV